MVKPTSGSVRNSVPVFAYLLISRVPLLIFHRRASIVKHVDTRTSVMSFSPSGGQMSQQVNTGTQLGTHNHFLWSGPVSATPRHQDDHLLIRVSQHNGSQRRSCTRGTGTFASLL